MKHSYYEDVKQIFVVMHQLNEYYSLPDDPKIDKRLVFSILYDAMHNENKNEIRLIAFNTLLSYIKHVDNIDSSVRDVRVGRPSHNSAFRFS